MAGRGRPEATWLATPASRRAAPAAPASSEVLGPERVHKGLWRLAPLHPIFPRGQVGFLQPLCPHLSRLVSLDSEGPPDPSSVCCQGLGGAPLQLCPPLASFPPGQGPHCLLRPLFPEPWGSAGPRPSACPQSGHGQSTGHYAKAAQEAPWVARWALTGPPQVPHLQAVTPKEQNELLPLFLLELCPTHCLSVPLRLLGPPTPDHSVINCRLHRCPCRCPWLPPHSAVSAGEAVSGALLSRRVAE